MTESYDFFDKLLDLYRQKEDLDAKYADMFLLYAADKFSLEQNDRLDSRALILKPLDLHNVIKERDFFTNLIHVSIQTGNYTIFTDTDADRFALRQYLTKNQSHVKVLPLNVAQRVDDINTSVDRAVKDMYNEMASLQQNSLKGNLPNRIKIVGFSQYSMDVTNRMMQYFANYASSERGHVIDYYPTTELTRIYTPDYIFLKNNTVLPNEKN